MSNSELRGLSGWLSIVAIGVLLSPVRIYFDLLSIYPDLFKNGTWYLISNKDSSEYISGLSTFLYIEIAMGLALLSASVYLVYLFFTKKKTFPKLYIIIVVSAISMFLIDILSMTLFYSENPTGSKEELRKLIPMVVSALIWIPYVIRSRRVKNTFVVPHSSRNLLRDISVIYTSFLVVFFLYLTAIKYEPVIVGLKNQLVELANNTNAKLPKMLDQETRLDSVHVKGKKFQYHFSLVNYKESDMKYKSFVNELRKSVTKASCKNELTSNIIKKGAVIDYSYFDKVGSLIVSIKVKKSDCV